MPNPDTSPAALRALATNLDSYAPAMAGPGAETYRSAAHTLRALAAEKEASDRAPEVVAIRHSFDGHGWQYADAGNGSDWVERALQRDDAELLCVASLPAFSRAATVKPDLTVGATDRLDALALWKAHGGDTYGPHVEHVRMPLSKFAGFVDAALTPLRASLAAAEKERDAALRLAVLGATESCRREVPCAVAYRLMAEHKTAEARAEKAEADLKYVNEARTLDLADHQTKIKEMAERIRKAEAERDAARWQPIETAPRDGTLIDLWAGERIANCAWNVPSKCWAERVGAGFGGKHWAVVNNPTHWMPLPAAPANPEDPAHA